MTSTRALAGVFAAARIAYAVGLTVLPQRTAAPWLGGDARRRPAQVAIRGLAVRDGLIAGGILAAALGDAPLRPWLGLCIAGDAADIAATFAAGDSLPDQARTGTLAVAGGTALAAAALAAAAER